MIVFVSPHHDSHTLSLTLTQSLLYIPCLAWHGNLFHSTCISSGSDHSFDCFAFYLRRHILYPRGSPTLFIVPETNILATVFFVTYLHLELYTYIHIYVTEGRIYIPHTRFNTCIYLGFFLFFLVWTDAWTTMRGVVKEVERFYNRVNELGRPTAIPTLQATTLAFSSPLPETSGVQKMGTGEGRATKHLVEARCAIFERLRHLRFLRLCSFLEVQLMPR